MPDYTTSIEVKRYNRSGLSVSQDVIIKERPITLFVNGRELAVVVCSPVYLKELAVGFLFSEGFFQGKEDLRTVIVDEKEGVIRVEAEGWIPSDENLRKRYVTTCSGRGKTTLYLVDDVLKIKPTDSSLVLSIEEILYLSGEIEKNTIVFRSTGGTHGVSLCTSKEVICTFEDIGRHNAVDKMVGHCLLNGISMDDKVIVFSGRISSEIIIKIARIKSPMIISRGAPTDMALGIAKQLGITVIGFARPDKFNIYSNDQRITIGKSN